MAAYRGRRRALLPGPKRCSLKRYVCACALLGASCHLALAQQPAAPTPLAALLAEAAANNTRVATANDAWEASTHVAKQVSTLPDPVVTLKDFSVGSPNPAAGFHTSNFAYFGFGASQTLPWPGKLKLKSEAAKGAAAAQKANTAVVRSTVAEQVKLAYLRLASLYATLAILDRTDSILHPLVQNALSRYSLGLGIQAGVIKAQLERTKLLREQTAEREEAGEAQADLKQLLHRRQDSPDIVPEALSPTPFPLNKQQLQAMVQAGDPVLRMDADTVRTQEARLKSAKSERKPDFNVAYMFQITGNKYPDYYVGTLNIQLPRRARASAAIAEAAARKAEAADALDSQTQLRFAEAQKQFVAVTSSAEILDEYRQGLIPQAQAVFRAEEASYESGKREFEFVLSSLLDLTTFETGYQQSLLEHETALARLETLTGATLR